MQSSHKNKTSCKYKKNYLRKTHLNVLNFQLYLFFFFISFQVCQPRYFVNGPERKEKQICHWLISEINLEKSYYWESVHQQTISLTKLVWNDLNNHLVPVDNLFFQQPSYNIYYPTDGRCLILCLDIGIYSLIRAAFE